MARTVRFADLFAGIGGFHIAFQSAGAHCVFVSEWDDAARKTYLHNFKSKSKNLFGKNDRNSPNFAGDITTITNNPRALQQMPNFDVLCAGFPCQPFSQAGLKKGLEETRGTLFFDILKILEEKKPEAFFLENVRGLLTHKSATGVATMEVIRKQLTNAGYYFGEYLVKASDYGVPQHRPRLFIVGFRSPENFKEFQVPKSTGLKIKLSDILGGDPGREIGYTLRVGGRNSGLGDRRNWDTYLVDGRPLVIQPKHGLKLQGFPEWFSFPEDVSETQAMKQLGNSVAVPAVEAFARQIVRVLES